MRPPSSSRHTRPPPLAPRVGHRRRLRRRSQAMWAPRWLASLTGGGRKQQQQQQPGADSMSSGLPALTKPQQQRQPGAAGSSDVGGVLGPPLPRDYCSRMVFRLTPRYSSQLQARVRWLRVLRLAQQPAGGGWPLQFPADDMTPGRLARLAQLIDTAFLDGSFATVCGPPSYEVREQPPDAASTPGLSPRAACRAVAGFEPQSNTIIFFRPGWRRNPSLRCPVQADGVVCTNKLAWLAHTLGHEMVHAVLHHACSESSSAGGHHEREGGHGPAFRALNRHIFGHHTSRYTIGWSRLAGAQLTVQPLVPLHQQLDEAGAADGQQQAALQVSPLLLKALQARQQQSQKQHSQQNGPGGS